MTLPSSDHPTGPLPSDVPTLQAEVMRLRKTLHEVFQEKNLALRLLRRMNTDLDGRVRGQTQQLSSLHQLITTINASLDLNQVSATALVGLRTLLNVERAYLALRDSAGDIRYVMVQPSDTRSTPIHHRLTPGAGVVGRVIDTGRAFVANEARQDPGLFRELDSATGLETQSVLCEPLGVREHIIGAVQLVNKRSGAFTDSDRAFVETVAGSLAIAVENARMYEEVQTQLRALERAHAELVATQAQLVQSAKLASIGQLAAGLAHEMNNPIGIILGFAQLIGQRYGDEKLKGYAAAIEREAMRVRRIVEDLLGFARQTAAATTRIDLRQTADEALNLVEYQMTKENIRVHRRYSAEPAWVMADPDQVLQVLMNLIQNARQAMPTGGEMTVSTWSEGSWSLIAVADTGVGISPENLERIFDPFYTTKPVGQGTGLGLSVSYGIIGRHGGDIQVASQVGAGTTFTIRLPAASKQS